jgi:hypothetical protein
MSGPNESSPSTPDATASVAQSKDAPAAPVPAQESVPAEEPGSAESPADAFTISPFLARHVHIHPYTRRPNDPIYRPLRIFALDPAVSKLDGAVALVNVPYEPLRPGPRGRLFHVEEDTPCDLDDRRILVQQGFSPSRSDHRFHQQMVYAVCSSVYAAFKAALGRDPGWGFERDNADEGGADPGALMLRPRRFEGRNAYYDKVDGSLNFGYFTAEDTAQGFMKGERVFTCLSHDVIAHELTHALLDGLRAHFTIPTQVDVLAFHEAFADLVAVFQHFSYRQVVLAAIQKSAGQLTGGLLTDLARPLGRSTDRPSPLRRAIDAPDAERLRYRADLEPHELGSVLVLAVFEAFNAIYKRKTARYIRMATGGTGNLPLGQLPPDLQDVLAEEASQLASQFLAICIRAVDYCPPVDLEFGEFLRAVITADRELVPDDPWGYREAWIDAFRDRGILPSRVSSLDEEALAWRAPDIALKRVHALSFARLRFRGDPARPAGAVELRRQATALGEVVANPKYTAAFGLLPTRKGRILPPCIESIRSARRIGPDGQVLFDIVAEISQRSIDKQRGSNRASVLYGGSTVILGPAGDIRYVIGKGVASEARLCSQLEFMKSDLGTRYWQEGSRGMAPKPNLLQMLHKL